MKTKLSALTSIAGCLLVTACVSTEPGKVDMQVNTVPYEWKDDKSFAYNMAFVTNKVAGVEDVGDGEQAQQEMSTAGVLGDLALGLAGGGLVGVAGQGATSANQARAYDWKPMYLIKAQPSQVSTDQAVFEAVDVEFAEAFSKINETSYQGLVRVPNSYNKDSNFFVLFTGKLCNGDEPSLSGRFRSDTDLSRYSQYASRPITSEKPIRSANFNISVSPYVVDNFDQDAQFIVVEHVSTVRMVDYLKHRMGDYAVIPKIYGYPTETGYDTGDAHVISSDYVHLFSTSDKAISISEFHFP